MSVDSSHPPAVHTKTKPNPNPNPYNQQVAAADNARQRLDDQSTRSTWSHRAWMATGCVTLFICLAKSIIGAANSHIWLQPILASLVSYLLADLASGLYHWGIDNYGRANTPFFGPQIEAFRGHHKLPSTITRSELANNLHELARAVTFTVLPFDLFCDNPTILGFVGVWSGFVMFSQQIHTWAHGTKNQLPPLVVALQDLGLLVSRWQHAAHHRPPYNDNYCIVSGVWNKFLDRHKIFEALELVVFSKLGVRPRSWDDPNSDWTRQDSDICKTYHNNKN